MINPKVETEPEVPWEISEMALKIYVWSQEP